jgi:hypothetical protein
MMEALLSFLRRQVGLRTDAASSTGSLHGKLEWYGEGIINDVANTRKDLIIPQWVVPLLGDGSLGNKTISSNTTLNPKEIYQYNNLTVNADTTLTAHGAVIMVRDTLTVSGLISASGMGAAGGSGSSGGVGKAGYGFAGAGGGGSRFDRDGGAGGSTTFKTGGAGGTSDSNKGKAGEGWSTRTPAGLWSWPDYIINAQGGGGGGGGGSGGVNGASGNGGAGGGALFILARNIIVNSGGAIRADGVSTDFRGGGGGGGLVYLLATESFVQNGEITALGGTADPGGKGGNGCVIKVVLSDG